MPKLPSDPPYHSPTFSFQTSLPDRLSPCKERELPVAELATPFAAPGVLLTPVPLASIIPSATLEKIERTPESGDGLTSALTSLKAQ